MTKRRNTAPGFNTPDPKFFSVCFITLLELFKQAEISSIIGNIFNGFNKIITLFVLQGPGSATHGALDERVYPKQRQEGRRQGVRAIQRRANQEEHPPLLDYFK